MIRLFCCIVSSILVLLFTVPSMLLGQTSGIHPIIYDDVPLTGHAGVEIASLSNRLHASQAGHLVLNVTLSGNGIDTSNDGAVIAIDPNGEMRLVAREGVPITGTSPEGSTFFFSDPPLFVDQFGDVAFAGGLKLADSSNKRAIFYRTPGELDVVVFDGQEVEGAVFSPEKVWLTQAEQFAFSGTLGSSQSGIWRNSPTPEELLVGESIQYSGLPEGKSFGDIDPEFFLNLDDEILFSASGVDGTGFWMKQGDGVVEVVAFNEPAPGLPDATLLPITSVENRETRFSENGWVAFKARIHGEAVLSDNDECVWISEYGATSLVAREGEPVPGIQGIFGNAFSIQGLTSTGIVLFANRLDLSEGGTASTLWTWNERKLEAHCSRRSVGPRICRKYLKFGIANRGLIGGGQGRIFDPSKRYSIGALYYGP